MESRFVAVLEIGSTGIRLLVAEISGHQWRAVDRAGRPVALGRDVFTSGELSRESVLECLAVLQNYRELLAGWGIAGADIHAIATSALRVARNRDVFIDRVRQETGFNLSIVEGIEENRLMYLAVRFALKQDLPLFWRANSMIIEIGGGSTEIMLLRRGQMVAAHSIRLGTIIIDQRSRLGIGAGLSPERYLNETIRNTSGLLNAEMELSHVRTLVVAGSDARFAADQAGRELNENCRIIERKDFITFVDNIRGYTIEECVQKLKISYAEAEGFIPGILTLKLFLERTGAAQLVVPLVTIREGYLIDLALGVDSELQEEFFSQIIASAVSLGRKFHYDEAHSRHVADLCMSLFDALTKEHGMNRRHPPRYRHVYQGLRSPQARPVYCRQLGDIRPAPGRTRHYRQRYPLSPGRPAVRVGYRIHHPSAGGADTGAQNGVDPPGCRRAGSRPFPANTARNR
jgi:exopolyphosphatase/guanosine-5'-triphosphate,3'-diphosphate pyrophosphatase